MLTEDSPRMQECRRIGIKLLGKPALPLVRIAQFLYLSGSFKTFSSLVDQFKEPVYTDGLTYDKPDELLRSLLPALQFFEALKKPTRLIEIPTIVDMDDTPLNSIQAVEAWVRQQVLAMELEMINSMLCEPCGCTLCCTGPENEGSESSPKEFCEIPLGEDGIDDFQLDRIDNDLSRSMSAKSEPSLERDSIPFYKHDPALYHWKKGWSMILPKGSDCPQLEPEIGLCRMYFRRPVVCRNKQIFPHIIEEIEKKEGCEPVFMLRNKITAVWDCPYVQELKKEIGDYARRCDLAPVFVGNKAYPETKRKL